MLEIIITNRPADVLAMLADDSTIWGCGASRYEALGNLINAHPERFNVKITELDHTTE